RDADSEEHHQLENRFSWSSYHIENYLLEPRYISRVLDDLLGGKDAPGEEEIERDLFKCASETMQALIVHKASLHMNGTIVSALSTKIDPHTEDVSRSLFAAFKKSRERLDHLSRDVLSEETIKSFVTSATAGLAADLKSGRWRKSFRGRDIMKR